MTFFEQFSSNRRRQALSAVALCCLVTVLPSCKTPALRGADPTAPVPDTFNGVSSPDNSAHASIEEFFPDPVLVGLIQQGLYGNQQLKILGEDIQIANNEVLKRRGAYIPFVSIGGRSSVDKPSLYTPAGAVDDQLFSPNGHHFPTPLPNFLMAANLSWQVDIWRQLRNARDAANLRYLGTTEGRNYVVTRLVAEIAENYYNLLALDKTLENLDRIIALQEESLQKAEDKKEFALGNDLAVQRFRAEVRKNQSQKLIVSQQIIEVENKINYLAGRFPQTVERSTDFYNLELPALALGFPSDMLMNRPDIRQAERELEAAGLDVLVAKANFYPKLNISAGVGYEAFNAKYLIRTPESLIYGVAGDLVAPLINKRAIRADYMTANAMQLQAVYKYQQTVLNAFTEVINRVNKVHNYSVSLDIKRQQLDALEKSVEAASNLFLNARVDYIDVLLAQRDLNDARLVFVDTKKEQLSAIVNTYQALGGGLISFEYPDGSYVPQGPYMPGNFVPQAAPAGPAQNGIDVPPVLEQPQPPPAQVPPAQVPPAAKDAPPAAKDKDPAAEPKPVPPKAKPEVEKKE